MAYNNNCRSNKRKLHCSWTDSHRFCTISYYLKRKRERDSNLTQTFTRLFLVPNWKPSPIVLLSKIGSSFSTHSLISFFMCSANCLGMSFKTPLHKLTCAALTTKIFTSMNLVLSLKDVWPHFKLARRKLKSEGFFWYLRVWKLESVKSLAVHRDFCSSAIKNKANICFNMLKYNKTLRKIRSMKGSVQHRILFLIESSKDTLCDYNFLDDFMMLASKVTYL